MSKKYITAVFEYEDGAELPAQITAAFAKDEYFHGAKIKTLSHEGTPKKTQSNAQAKTDAIRLKADLETIRLAALIPKSYTPENRVLVYKIVGVLIFGVFLFALFVF